MNTNDPSRNFTDLDEAMNRLFDHELSEEEQDQLARELEHNPEALRRFRETTNILLALREPTDAPDLTDAVLKRVHEHARLVPGRARRPRRVFSASRLAAAAALLVAGAGIALLRHYPQQRPLTMAREPVETLAPDPLVTRMLDPELAQRELAAINAAAAEASSLMPLLSRAGESMLDRTPIRLSLSPIDGLAGASDWSSSDLPYHLTSELSLSREWNAGSFLLPLPTLEPLDAVLDPNRAEPLTDRHHPLLWGPSLELKLESPTSDSEVGD